MTLLNISGENLGILDRELKKGPLMSAKTVWEKFKVDGGERQGPQASSLS
jgi:hypothetical protein